MWPPPQSLVTTPSPVFLSKIRWDAAHFVPVTVIDALLSGRAILAEHWVPDPESGCLLRRDRPGSSPFRITTRNRAAVDRLSPGSIHVDSYACIEFESNSGLWCIARFPDASARNQWSDRVTAAFRLLADTGFGAGRVIGWGQTSQPEVQEGNWPNLLLPRSTKSQSNGGNGSNTAYWLLSVYSPAPSDSLEWSGGDYQLVTRSGHDKKAVRMVAEGSVLIAAREPSGVAVDVAGGGHAHPIYRAGFAVAVRLPEPTQEDIKPVEEPSDIEAPEPKPCPEGQPVVAEPESAQAEPESDAASEAPQVAEVTEEAEPHPEISPQPSDLELPAHTAPEHTQPTSQQNEVQEATERPSSQENKDEL
jgi:hypothetical protein